MYRLLLSTILLYFITLTGFTGGSVFAQDVGKVDRHEMGFWIGASNPMSTSPVGDVLRSSVGAGIFYRVNWPWVFNTEIGGMYGSYESSTTQKLTAAPMYIALVYQLPLPYRLNVHLKAGGGSSYVEVRPENKSGWDPLYFVGTEFSLMASRKLRIGLRLDYFYIQESHMEPPSERDYYMYYAIASRQPGQSFDPRIFNNYQYNLVDGQFLNLGLMISFFL